jgi:hypothetical protein
MIPKFMLALRNIPQPKWQSEYDLLLVNFEGDESIFLIELDRVEYFPTFIADCNFHCIK